MRVSKINTIILALYLYVTPISVLFSTIYDSFYIRNFILILLIIFTIIINKFKLNRQIILFYSFLIVFISLNILLVDHKSYVFADGMNLLLFSFIPIYLIGQKIVSILDVTKIWGKIATLFTFLLPIYYIYRDQGIISYYEIGFLTHINILIFVFNFIATKKTIKSPLFIYILLNMIILMIFGSRMILVATIFTTLVTYLMISNKRSLKYYVKIIVVSFLLIFIGRNLVSILTIINESLQNYGIQSRNISMFIMQLTDKYEDTSEFLSGRDSIYPVILEYLSNNWHLPSGFSMARKLTNGVYYHSHNFVLELLLIFGGFITLFIIGVFFYKVFLIVKNRNQSENKLILYFFSIVLISFLVRSLTGTHFVNDVVFQLCLAILISVRRIKSDKVSYEQNNVHTI